MARIQCMVVAVAFMVTFAVVKANQSSRGGECPSDNEPRNVLSLLQTKLQTNVFMDGNEEKQIHRASANGISIGGLGHDEVSRAIQRIGVFFQVANISVWPEMFQCLQSIVEAEAAEVGVHISTHSSSGDISQLKNDVTTLQSWNAENSDRSMSVQFSSMGNAGSDIGAFLSQVQESYTSTNKAPYDVILKMHSKSDTEWRRLGLQSLCGTKFHVRAILSNFATSAKLGMIAPVGTVFSAETHTSDIAPVIAEKYFQGSAVVGEGAANMAGLQSLFAQISPEHKDDAVPSLVVAGNMYWMRYEDLRPEALVRSIPDIQKNLTDGYVEKGVIGHAIEGFIPSLIVRLGHSIAHMPPAPKVMAIYFPQYHAFPENDRFWGTGFTEWSLLKPCKLPGIRKPLSEDQGGLGYYDLNSVNTRRLQGKLAKRFGVHGFMFYHYWFSGDGVQNHSVMWKVPHLLLQDGEPNRPFFFSWANEPWTRHWNGNDDGEALLPQEYGAKAEWQTHFEWLVPYFKNEKYMKVDGKPMFALYRPGHLKDKLRPMFKLWSDLAGGHGFGGMYFVSCVGGWYNELVNDPNDQGVFDAGYHFVPHNYIATNVNGYGATASTVEDLPYVREHHQFWGASTGFYNGVRGGDLKFPFSPPMFKERVKRSFNNMGTYPKKRLPDNYFFVAAWNEWNEQNVLEPDDTYEFQYLEALQSALETITAVPSL